MGLQDRVEVSIRMYADRPYEMDVDKPILHGTIHMPLAVGAIKAAALDDATFKALREMMYDRIEQLLDEYREALLRRYESEP